MWKVNWWKPKNFSLLLLAALALSACKKEEPQDVDLGYDYFPNTVGTFIEYEVDSSYYESGVETNTQFYVREEYTETFIDGEGQLAMKIDRYTRPTLSDGWTRAAVYSQKRTSTTPTCGRQPQVHPHGLPHQHRAPGTAMHTMTSTLGITYGAIANHT